jgi:hypothetical protein
MVYGMQCQGIISGEKVEHQGALVLRTLLIALDNEGDSEYDHEDETEKSPLHRNRPRAPLRPQ